MMNFADRRPRCLVQIGTQFSDQLSGSLCFLQNQIVGIKCYANSLDKEPFV